AVASDRRLSRPLVSLLGGAAAPAAEDVVPAGVVRLVDPPSPHVPRHIQRAGPAHAPERANRGGPATHAVDVARGKDCPGRFEPRGARPVEDARQPRPAEPGVRQGLVPTESAHGIVGATRRIATRFPRGWSRPTRLVHEPCDRVLPRDTAPVDEELLGP